MSGHDKTITVRIRRDGSVEAETHGLKGAECLPYIGVLQELLQAEVVDSRFTEEYYEAVGEGESEERETEVLLEGEGPS